MKKIYPTILFMLLSILTYAQGAEFEWTFEEADPLGTDKPTGITIVDAGGTNVQVKDLGSVAQVANSVTDDGSGTNNTLSMDRQSHIILDETVLGNGSFSIVAKYEGSGNGDNSMSIGNVQDTGFISIAVFDSEPNPGVWALRRLHHKFANGQMNGLKIGNTANAFGSRLPVRDDLLEGMKHVVLTYNDTDGLFRLYIEGDLDGVGGDNGGRLTGNTNVKVYLSYRGGSIDSGTGAVTASLNGDGDSKDVKSEWDNIAVFKRALSDQDVLDLYNGANPLTLAIDQVTLENFNAYPNPVKDHLHFSSRHVKSIEVFNVLGTKVMKRTIIGQSGANFSALANGIYIVKAFNQDNTHMATIKVVKK
ncbi:T9SS type A sorting domain-containing protein [Seonamhaeicola sp.]|uniref:T9SS type A sorting domain-containing protein n=1 Tax=Seonamhaeicola sp. TaxID=1912245 RepID=UPI00263814BC|nr:T9SS type A sorting domain-containing protein [Seonamhaeicola sp.]